MKKPCWKRSGSSWSQQVGFNGMSILKKQFSLFSGAYSNLQMIVGRIFQRVPDLVQELEDEVEEAGGGHAARKRKLIDLVLDKVGCSKLWSSGLFSSR